MRAPITLGALAVSTLLTRVNAQASAYGNPDGEPNSGDGSDGYPDGTAATATAPGDVPEGNSVQPTCPFGGHETTTVFVTVSPSDTVSSVDVSGVEGPAPSTTGGISSGNAGSDGTTTHWKDTRPTGNAVLSSIEASISQHPVKPFTTMTIDIWGNDSGSGGTNHEGSDASPSTEGSNSSRPGNAGSGNTDSGDAGSGDTGSGNAGSGSDSGDAGSGGDSGNNSNTGGQNPSGYDTSQPGNDSSPPTPPSYTDKPDSDGSDQISSGLTVFTVTSFVQPTPTFVSSGAGYPPGGPQGYTSDQSPVTASGNAQTPGGGSPWYTVVTDTDVHWTDGPSGPSPITTVSPHTMASGVDLPGSDSGSPRSATGSPGNDTAGDGDSNPSSDENSGADSSTCATIIGADGKPTVIGGGASGANNSPFPVSTPVDVPSGITSLVIPGPVNGSSAAPVTTCVTLTVLGDDGLPTVVDSTFTLPATPATVGGSDGGSAGLPSLTIPPGDGAGVTTCATYTVLGGDGKPTVIESSFVIPTASDTGDLTGSALTNTVPGQITAAPSSQDGESNNEAGTTTCITYTYLGPDGNPTVVESSVVLPAPTVSNVGFPTALPTGLPGQAPGIPNFSTNVDGIPNNGAETTCTSYTYIGADGLPTVIETSWTAPGPLNTPGSMPNAPTPVPVTSYPGSAYNGGVTGEPLTTCYTYLGADGKPTVVETTYAIPQSVQTVAGISTTSPAFSDSLPGQFSGVPGGIPGNNGGTTTCVSYTIVGPNGSPTVLETTFVIGQGTAFPFTDGPVLTPGNASGLPNGWPWSLTTGTPSLPEGYSVDGGNDGAAVYTTATFIGPDGVLTSVVESTAIGIPQLTASWPQYPTPGSGNNSGPPNAKPGLSQYGGGNILTPSILPPSFQPFSPIVTQASADPVSASGIITDVQTSTFTILVGPGESGLPAGAGLPPSYGDSMDGGLPAPGDSPDGQISQMTVWPTPAGYSQTSDQDAGQAAPAYGTPTVGDVTTRLQVSTWENIIPEQTTTYTMNFPFTTIESFPIQPPMTFKRMARRQFGPFAWGNSTTTPSTVFEENTSLGASISAALSVVTPTPSPTQPTPVADSGSDLCASGGKIGNTTINFDDLKPGPLFNPSDDFWFSEGFLIAPPSSQSSQSYIASSGGQLVEFVPQALSNPSSQGSGDVAEIGVGPNAQNSCFRFNFYGASLGCEASATEQFCEFEISAYTFVEGASAEQSIAWSETKRVPACTSFPSNNCALTAVDFEGYNDITAVLITLRVGLDLRVWWGDDFRVGWTDNSCQAAVCRANPDVRRVKRDQVASVIRQGAYHWTPRGLERLDDEMVWEAAK